MHFFWVILWKGVTKVRANRDDTLLKNLKDADDWLLHHDIRA